LTLDPSLASEPFCYLTTTGRVSGNPHEIEIWFVLQDTTAYLMAGNHRSDWVLNARKQPAVTLRIGDRSFNATARAVLDPAEDAEVRRLMLEKYASPRDPLESWGRTAVPVAFDLNIASRPN
jgi:deazaflavin-dependent oxidoreductase (nitroreductase family)